MSRPKPSPARLPHAGPSAWLWIAAAAGVAAGLVVATTSAPLALIALVVAGVGTALILRTPEIGLLTLVFAGYINLSDVLIEFHGGVSLTKLLVPLVIVAVLLRWVRQGERPEGWLLPALLVSTYGLVCVLSLLAAKDPRLTLAGLTELVKNGLIFILVAILVRNAATLRRVLWTLIAAAGLLGTIAVHQQLTGNFDFSYWGFGRATDSFALDGQSTIRLGGPVGDPNFFGMMLLAAVPLALDRLSAEKKWGPKMVALWALLVSTLTIVFTYSRSASLSLLALLALFAVVRRPRPAHLLAAALVALLLVPLVPGTYSQRLLRLWDSAVEFSERGTTGEISVRGRLSENLVATEMFLDHPVIGVGLANYPANYLGYSRRLGLDPRDEDRPPHSLYLEVLSETGALGFAAFALVIWTVFRGALAARRTLREADQPDLAHLVEGFTLSFAGYLIASLFLHSSHPRYFWLLAGIALALPQVARSELSGGKRAQAPEGRDDLRSEI